MVSAALFDKISSKYIRNCYLNLIIGSLSFDCQHGEVECEANIIHCCTVEAVHEPEIQLGMVACMIRDNANPQESFQRVSWTLLTLFASVSHPNSYLILPQCAREYNTIDIETIQKCYTSPHGKELLKIAGEATKALRPSVSFIPTITLDGDQRSQKAILKNLLAEICDVLKSGGMVPKACESM